VHRPFDLLDKRCRTIQFHSGTQPGVIGFDKEALPGRQGLPGFQPQANHVVDDAFERLARLTGELMQLRRHVVFQGKGGSHIVMLSTKTS